MRWFPEPVWTLSRIEKLMHLPEIELRFLGRHFSYFRTNDFLFFLDLSFYHNAVPSFHSNLFSQSPSPILHSTVFLVHTRRRTSPLSASSWGCRMQQIFRILSRLIFLVWPHHLTTLTSRLLYHPFLLTNN